MRLSTALLFLSASPFLLAIAEADQLPIEQCPDDIFEGQTADHPGQCTTTETTRKGNSITRKRSCCAIYCREMFDNPAHVGGIEPFYYCVCEASCTSNCGKPNGMPNLSEADYACVTDVQMAAEQIYGVAAIEVISDNGTDTSSRNLQEEGDEGTEEDMPDMTMENEEEEEASSYLGSALLTSSAQADGNSVMISYTLNADCTSGCTFFLYDVDSCDDAALTDDNKMEVEGHITTPNEAPSGQFEWNREQSPASFLYGKAIVLYGKEGEELIGCGIFREWQVPASPTTLASADSDPPTSSGVVINSVSGIVALGAIMAGSIVFV